MELHKVSSMPTKNLFRNSYDYHVNEHYLLKLADIFGNLRYLRFLSAFPSQN